MVELFGLVIGSFLNAVIHRVALRMRDVNRDGMLGNLSGDRERCLGSFSGLSLGVLMATGMFRRRSTLPFGAFLAVPGVLPLFLGEEL